MTVFLDFETRSEADLKKVGAWAYSEHPSTEVICACWAEDDDELIQEWLNPAISGELRFQEEFAAPAWEAHAQLGQTFEAHNVAFEYSIWHNVCVSRYGWPAVPLEQWRDSMAVACYYALPAALGNLCRVLGLPGKDPEGERLITKYCKLHLKTARREIPPEDLAKFLKYCSRDVWLERAAGGLLGELPEEELAVFLNDLRVNERGIPLDAEGITAAQLVVDARAGELEEEFRELTGARSDWGPPERGLGPGQRDKILAWLAAHDLKLPNLQATTIDELLDDGIISGEDETPHVSPEARRVLEVRRQHARASTKKLDAMMRQRGRDGRARFQTRYHGAGTGRNTGTGFQPLNLMRNWDRVDPEQLVRDVMYGDPRWLDCVYGDAMEAVGKATRHWIKPREGHHLLAGDFASIEAVVNACLAGEGWKVQLFRDRGDPYATFASRAVGRTVLPKDHPDVTRQDLEDRQNVGKPGELAFGYQGALGAWYKFDRSGRFTDGEILAFVRQWRDLHPAHLGQWADLEAAALEAVTYPGRVTGARDQEVFERVDGWLTMILPDGKRVWYWAPEIRMLWPQWHRPGEEEECATGECGHTRRPQVTYMAQKEGHWRRVSSYGGKWTENRVQATARQVLKPIELRVRDAGYRQVLGVYDEVVCEVPDGQGSAAELAELMNEPAGDWCAHWPIRATVWEGQRYKK